MQEFVTALTKLGVECRLVKDTDYSRGFPSKNVNDWFFGNSEFKKLVKNFKPDAVFVDRQTHFGVHAIKAKLPLFVLLRGHYWSEIDFARRTLYKGPLMRLVLWFRNRVAEKCFRNSTIVFPICDYLTSIVKEHHPNVQTSVFFEGIDKQKWYSTSEMHLNHPCVGLLQDANWWGKTKEMLILKKVLEKLPDVNFYWAGDGPYREDILRELNQYSNFKWLGRLQYPDKVRDYLSEIDIYALITGMDLAPLTLKEAQLMEKPVIATNVGGVPEMMQDKKTGFLVNEGDSEMLINKIKILISDNTTSKQLGKNGRKFVEDTFNWDTIARNFLDAIKSRIKI